MACPYFYPTGRFEFKMWPHPSRLPLGDGYTGICLAGAEEFQPGEAALKDGCNLGYARKCCDRVPSGGPDAVRFAVTSDSGNLIRISFAVEKAHLPHEHGALEFDRSRRAFANPHPNRILERQAEAYVESYLRRTHER